MFLELNALLFLYPFNTVKTRIQSQHKTQDVAYFLKNKVGSQRNYNILWTSNIQWSGIRDVIKCDSEYDYI